VTVTSRLAGEDLVLRDGVALAGPTLEELPFRTLTLRDGTIGEVDEPGADRGGARVLDLGGAFVLPGLVDAHVHFDLAAGPDAYAHWRRSALVRSATCLRNGLVALRHGITSVRHLGSADHLVVEYAEHVRRGALTGPRVAAAGRFVTMTGGHFWQYGREADGEDDVRRAVREQIRAGASVIKVMATGGISTPGVPGASQLSEAELRVAVEEARKAGLPVSAHAHGADGVRAAVAAEVDTVEHGAFLDDEAVAALVASGTVLVPTLSALSPIAPGLGIPPDTVDKSLRARDTYATSISRAIRAGVRIAAGTDAGTALNPVGGLVDELEMYRAGGMTAHDAVVSATVTAGSLLGSGAGTIARGAPADLVTYPADPREDLDVLRAPGTVVRNGRVLDEAWLDETIEELADVSAP
jgi:imidazolonepropionase-like amidohydrolase